MGRKNAISTVADFKDAVAYLRRALSRSAQDVFINPSQANQELTKLEQLAATLSAGDATGVFSAWIRVHLTPGGRSKMLGALRRKRADLHAGHKSRRSISLSLEVFREVERLSKATGGIPMPRLIESLAAVANVDKALQKKLFNLSVALGVKGRAGAPNKNQV